MGLTVPSVPVHDISTYGVLDESVQSEEYIELSLVSRLVPIRLQFSDVEESLPPALIVHMTIVVVSRAVA